MIKLVDLLESKTQPLAIFLAGSAGAGKTSFRREFIDPLGEFVVLNIDDEYEPLLKKEKLPLDFRKYTSPEQLSAAAKLMARAQKITRDKYEQIKSAFKNVVIDGTGASSREILKKKSELESIGYKTMMALIFTTPDISLYRNLKRGEEGGRTLMPSIILRSWSSLFDNIDTYKKIFGSNLLIYKAFKDSDLIFPDFDPSSEKTRKMFFDPFKVKGKEKSPEERAKSIENIKAMNAKIRSQIKKIKNIQFDDPKKIRTKIAKFAHV